jgi:hypothetical protein
VSASEWFLHYTLHALPRARTVVKEAPLNTDETVPLGRAAQGVACQESSHRSRCGSSYKATPLGAAAVRAALRSAIQTGTRRRRATERNELSLRMMMASDSALSNSLGSCQYSWPPSVGARGAIRRNLPFTVQRRTYHSVRPIQLRSFSLVLLEWTEQDPGLLTPFDAIRRMRVEMYRGG